ncbi:MAG: hypothetical protein EB084_08755 [Proteobacteria bacterium]|nr:hypothetical protein [Pseudomonadota bacterium]
MTVERDGLVVSGGGHRALLQPADAHAVSSPSRVPTVSAPPAHDGIRSARPLSPEDSSSPLLSTSAPAPAPPPTVIHVPMPSSPPIPVPVSNPIARGPRTTPDLGAGFPLAPPDTQPFVRRVHDFLAGKVPYIFNAGIDLGLSRVSSITERGLGINVSRLLDVERTMYRLMVPSRDAYAGGSPPIFQALAQGQAAYVFLNGDPEGSDRLTRLFAGLPPEIIIGIGAGNDKYTPVRQALIERLQRGDFPAFVDVDGDLSSTNGTESIAVESISSIARRENVLSRSFPDPALYYRWLVTRADSAYRRTEPWLDDVKPVLRGAITQVKRDLTPPWVSSATPDPFGSTVPPARTQEAYEKVMAQAGGGRPPSLHDLADFADTAISLDRDLVFAVQTYWSKLMREVSAAQRDSLFTPLARAWVSLNVIPPTDPDFDLVSPANAPYIELLDQRAGNRTVLERYDRAMALSEVVGHTLNGLGLDQRQTFLSSVVDEIRGRRDAVTEREQRVRQILGHDYQGIDVAAVLDGTVDGSNPSVRAALDQLERAVDNGITLRPMTPEHAEIQRHLSILSFMADRVKAFREPALSLAESLPPMPADPLIVGQYYKGGSSVPPSPLPVNGPSAVEVLGTSVSGTPVPTSVVFEGGGGKGFAYIECLKQVKGALRASDTSVAIDRFVGTSAGAITAGLLAAGYDENEMATIMQRLDFKKFYADYLWLAGGVDSQVRGFDRTGLFSTRQMYQTIDGLLHDKTGVRGRPVLFRDLPFKLSVVATVVSTDLPEDLRAQLGISKDGQIVLSSETTPNMDVAAAISGSAAVPTFFDAPQMIVTRDEPDGQGGTVKKSYRLQLVDGGAVDNFPVSKAVSAADNDPVLVVAPAYYEAPGPTPDAPPVSLSTLDFDASKLPVIDAFNRARYAEFAPQLGAFMEQARNGGSSRAVIGFNLATTQEQRTVAVQGLDSKATDRFRDTATAVGLETLSADAARKMMRDVYPRQPNHIEEKVLDGLLDHHNTFDSSLCKPPAYNLQAAESGGLADIIAAVMATQLVGPYHVDDKLFEH